MSWENENSRIRFFSVKRSVLEEGLDFVVRITEKLRPLDDNDISSEEN